MSSPPILPRSPIRRRSPISRLRLLATLLAAMLFAGSCSADAEVVIDSGDGSSGDVLASEVFDGEAVTVDGEVFDLAQLEGEDLVLWFWAPW